ncbi:MAG: SDR family NAD(P)-dependent oxidoreductase [Deltaproteobacteria bacterium]|nr:SDR family NAD(P)-dependent oxidoreductase [Deltaproteobacteria bacterium]
MDLAGKNVLVTGASRGIGRAIAHVFARAGARVLLTARTWEAVVAEADAIVSAGGQAWAHVMDVTNTQSVARAVACARREVGEIDVVINNAGACCQGYFVDENPLLAHHQMEVNYFGALRVIRAVLPGMRARRQGTIVNIASVVAAVPYPTEATHSATKAALVAFSQALRAEVADDGIRVVVVLPGHTDTDMGRRVSIKGPLVQGPEQVARVVLVATCRGRRQAVAGTSNRILVLASRVWPKLGEDAMASTARRSFPGARTPKEGTADSSEPACPAEQVGRTVQGKSR